MSKITVKVQVAGTHCWPDAPLHREYLRARHRHLFVIRASLHVTHDDREVEFHDLQADVQHALHTAFRHDDAGVGFGTASCEQIATLVGEWLVATHKRPVTVSVFEDDECGAEVTVNE